MYEKGNAIEVSYEDESFERDLVCINGLVITRGSIFHLMTRPDCNLKKFSKGSFIVF